MADAGGDRGGVADESGDDPVVGGGWDVADGTLRAMRPGKRKWFVRRSEVDRMLAGEDRCDPKAPETRPPADGWRPADFIEPPGRSPHWPPEAVEHVTRGGGWRAPRRSGETFCGRARWRRQTRGSRRLREIADAAARKAAAFANLEDQEPGPGGCVSQGCRVGCCRMSCGPAGIGRGRPCCGRGLTRRLSCWRSRWRAGRYRLSSSRWSTCRW